jgi:hypothetical protein
MANSHQGHFTVMFPFQIQNVVEEKVNILGGHSIGHSKQETVYVHVSYSELFPN